MYPSIADRLRLADPMAQAPELRQRVCHGPCSLGHVAPVREIGGDAEAQIRSRELVAELLEHREALEVEGRRPVEGAEDLQRAAKGPAGIRTEIRWCIDRGRKQPLEPRRALGGVTDDPERLEGGCEAQPLHRVAIFRPRERDADVVELRSDQVQLPPRASGGDAAEAGPIRDVDEHVDLTTTQPVLLTRLRQPLGRELPDRLEHPVAVGSHGIGAPTEEALVEEGRQGVELGVADLLRGLQRTAAAEHREAREQLLLGSVEEVVAPLDRRAQCRVPLVCVASPLSRSRR